MTKRSVLRMVALVGSILLWTTPAVAVAEPQPGTGILASDPTAAESIRFREAFGLRSDSTFVQGTLRNPAFSSEAYGVPLSTAEIAELFRRARIQVATEDDAIPFARTLPGFAGAYLDQHQGGRPVLLFTKPETIERDAIAKLLPDDADLQIGRARRTESELAELKARATAEREEWAAQGIDIVRVGIRPSLNTIRIGVLKLTSDKDEALKTAYGADVVVYETEVAHSDVCDAFDDCLPMKGGIAIRRSNSTLTQCSAGFVVRRTDTSGLAILTAGHCIEVHGGEGAAWKHNTVTFGVALKETWVGLVPSPGHRGPSDVGLISIQTEDVPATKNQMRRTNGSVASVTSYLLTPIEGGQACRVAQQGHKCGPISDPDVGHASPAGGGNMWVDHTAEVFPVVDAINGDSGAPMFYYPGGGTCCSPVRALGTHVHSRNPEDEMTWFSPYWVGRSDYDDRFPYTYNICLSASC